MLAAVGSDIFNALDAATVVANFLLEVTRDAEADQGISAAALRYTDSDIPITYGGQSFTLNDTLEAVDIRDVGGEVSAGRDAITIQLAGQPETLRLQWIETAAGVQLWNRNSLKAYSTFNNTPTNPATNSNTLQLFGGRCIQAVETITGIALTFAGPLTQVAGIKPFILTDAQQQQRAPGDTSLQYIDQIRPIRWGEK